MRWRGFPCHRFPYHRCVAQNAPRLPVDTSLVRPGLRLAVAVSGGADSVALLRALHAQSRELGLALHVAHLHHGIRGAEADADLAFVRDLAAQLDLPFHSYRTDTPAESAARPGKPAESIEEAARRLRYAWFRELLSTVPLDAVATAHTLDDQAETVVAKFLRGAWTEGLSGIHPQLDTPAGLILRPLLATTRAEVEQYLKARGQTWREDSTNRHLTYTRNRIRHELLPSLDAWNPRLREHLAQMAELARDEESWWTAELARIAPQLILPGRPVRGGGRASADGIALDLARFAELHPALQRRVLRHIAAQLGAAPDFRATESIRQLALTGRAGQKSELAQGLRAERTHRELRLTLQSAEPTSARASEAISYEISVPGEADAPGFGLHFRIATDGDAPQRVATLRPWKAGDRITLQHSSGPRKVKEVLERLKVSGEARPSWPVLELDGRILWMQGVTVQSQAGIRIQVKPMRTGPTADPAAHPPKVQF